MITSLPSPPQFPPHLQIKMLPHFLLTYHQMHTHHIPVHADAKHIQVMQRPDALHGQQLPPQPVQVYCQRCRVQQHRQRLLHDANGREEDYHREDKGARRVNQLRLRVDLDDHRRYEHPDALHKVPNHVDHCCTDIQVAAAAAAATPLLAQLVQLQLIDLIVTVVMVVLIPRHLLIRVTSDLTVVPHNQSVLIIAHAQQRVASMATMVLVTRTVATTIVLLIQIYSEKFGCFRQFQSVEMC